jgi:hypothetical protein
MNSGKGYLFSKLVFSCVPDENKPHHHDRGKGLKGAYWKMYKDTLKKMPISEASLGTTAGTNVMILKIFSLNFSAKKWRFFSKQSLILKKMIITLFF